MKLAVLGALVSCASAVQVTPVPAYVNGWYSAGKVCALCPVVRVRIMCRNNPLLADLLFFLITISLFKLTFQAVLKQPTLSPC